MTDNFRLVASNATAENIDYAVKAHLGSLGLYEDKEFERLKEAVESNSPFTVRWFPSKMDARTGRARLWPRDRQEDYDLYIQGVRRLDSARADKLMESVPGVKRFHAIGVVQTLKKDRDAMRPSVRDFLVRHANDPELLRMVEDEIEFETFKRHVIDNVRDDFNDRDLQAIYRNLTKVHKVFQRDPQKKPARKHDQGQKNVADTSEGQEPVNANEANEVNTLAEDREPPEIPPAEPTEPERLAHEDISAGSGPTYEEA